MLRFWLILCLSGSQQLIRFVINQSFNIIDLSLSQFGLLLLLLLCGCVFFGLSYICFASDFCFQGSKFVYVGCFVFFSDLCIQGSNFVCVGVVFSSVICVVFQAVILCVCCWCCVFFSDLCFQGSNLFCVRVWRVSCFLQ